MSEYFGDDIGAFRSSDSGTMKAAALALKTGHKTRLYFDLICDAGPDGLTRDELEKRVGARHQTVTGGSLKNGLIDKGLIAWNGKTRKTSSGRDAEVLTLTPHGREVARQLVNDSPQTHSNV